MNIGEAIAVNVLLDALLGHPRDTTRVQPSRDAVREAAAELASRANKALMCGWDSEDALVAAFRDQPPAVRP